MGNNGADRLAVTKTYKLFVGGKFPRTESGRSVKVSGADGAVLAHTCHASRKDLRGAIEASAKAQSGWSSANAYLRGQILYRLAEMMEGKRAELASSIAGVEGDETAALREVDASVDRVLAFAGWADKFQQIMGCANPVSGPYHNFSVAEATGVVVAVAPDSPSLLGLVSLVAPAVSVGCGVVVIASETNPIPACVLAEGLATSDLPGGVVNVLTGKRDELLGHIAGHREVNAVVAAGVEGDARVTLEAGAAENLKRVSVLEGVDWFDDAACEGPGMLERVCEIKTFWHPSSAG